MAQSEKKTAEGGTKKQAKKTAKKKSVKERETQPSAPELDRDQLESLREKLQRKYH